ncbi:helix-turn-helix domain-containing protein [Campylobacter sp. FMV-PI01]|uniref:Helix-turn-helix domain-containing protein n=1 Tax=Campylobacter portucalensis TaxID=2608384 RepID=A0A6L5WKD8_9BACT|nr:LexA family transcriptional regulator [Campylobacter portucalensis]MSN96323.1 helix-turn-helix domain-containing protein [Campylobacter portucalensis]
MDLAQRLKQLRDEKGWTQSDLAKFSGVSIDSIKGYEIGKTKNITTGNLKKIANAFNISTQDFFSSKLSHSEAKDLSHSVAYSVAKSKNLSHTPSNLKMSQNNDFDIVKIPYFEDTYASAGDEAINYDEMPVIMELDANFLRLFLRITTPFKNMHIINAKGDSMEPTIKDGELLYINPIANEGGINSGSIYVINFDGDVLVKRVDKNPITKALTLISDNPKYSPISIEKDNLKLCRIIGRVVAHTAKL